jgi:hypothetical protein
MSVLERDFYHLVADTVLTSHEYWNNLAVEAAVLSAKHYWANHAPFPEPEESLDLAKLPSLQGQVSPVMALVLRHTPRSLVSASRTPGGTMLMIWLVSGLCLIVARRFSLKGAGRSRGSGFITLTHLIVVAVGVFAAIGLPAAGVSWPGIMLAAVLLLVLGLALQWYSVIQSAGSVKPMAVRGLVAHDRLEPKL